MTASTVLTDVLTQVRWAMGLTGVSRHSRVTMSRALKRSLPAAPYVTELVDRPPESDHPLRAPWRHDFEGDGLGSPGGRGIGASRRLRVRGGGGRSELRRKGHHCES